MRISKLAAAASLVLGAVASGQAFAQATCPANTTRITGGNTLRDFVTGKTLCAASQTNNDRWQEFHNASGVLTDYKLGSDAVDPTEDVGRWSASNGINAELTHTYGTNPPYSWLVCQVGSANNYTLVSTGNSGTIINARFETGSGNVCGFNAQSTRKK